jgi:8-oxo-dGTP pyrophosphatase MutT (NUDIX family)
MSSSSGKNYFAPTMGLALAIVRHPETGKFLLVHETGNRGWWIPGGKVDPGEHFPTAVVRECVEEAGIHIALKGIIRFEHSVYGQYSRLRVVFYGEPIDLNEKPKSVADYESIEARWVTAEEVENGAFRLRGSEPLEFFRYIANGNHVMPLTAFTREGDPVRLREPSASFAPVVKEQPAAPATSATKKKKKKTKTKAPKSAGVVSASEDSSYDSIDDDQGGLPV